MVKDRLVTKLDNAEKNIKATIKTSFAIVGFHLVILQIILSFLSVFLASS